MIRSRLVRDRVLPILLSAVLLAGQWLSTQHGIVHAPWSTSKAPAQASAQASAQNQGRADSKSHVAGDATCVAIANLLLTAPPVPDHRSGDTARASPPPGWTPGDAPAPARLYRAQAARAPPAAFV